MHSRREFLIVGAGALLSINLPTYAQERTGHRLGATAVTQVFGDGVKLTAVAVEYHEPIGAVRKWIFRQNRRIMARNRRRSAGLTRRPISP